MALSDLLTMLKIVLSPKNIKFYKKHIHKEFKKDTNFSMLRAAKGLFYMIKGEKVVKHNDQYVITSFLPTFPSKAFLNHIFAVNDKTDIFTKNAFFDKSAPVSFYLSITSKCNYNCTHCSAKYRETGQELSTEQWIKVIKDIQDMGTSIIGFTGGEPLLRTDLEQIIQNIDDRSITFLYTSGNGLTKERTKTLKKSGLFSIGISLDSVNPTEHNEIRQNKKAFSNTIEAIQNSVEAGLYTMVQKVVMKKDISEEKLLEFFKFAKKYNVHEIRLLEPIRSGKLLINADNMKNVFYTKEDRDKLIKIQLKVNKKLNMPKITTFPYTESIHKYGCGAGIQHSYIMPDGELLPCDFVPVTFGNVKDNSIKELWSKMKKIMGNIPQEGCFSQKIYKNIQKEMEEKNKIPVNSEKMKSIIQKYKGKVYPQFFKALQKK